MGTGKEKMVIFLYWFLPFPRHKRICLVASAKISPGFGLDIWWNPWWSECQCHCQNTWRDKTNKMNWPCILPLDHRIWVAAHSSFQQKLGQQHHHFLWSYTVPPLSSCSELYNGPLWFAYKGPLRRLTCGESFSILPTDGAAVDSIQN